MNLDELLIALQAQKDAGMPGDTAVFLAGQSSDYAQRASAVSGISIAKPDHEKDRKYCKLVSNRGVAALIIN